MTCRNMQMRTALTHERLKEALHYDAETGVFTWKIATRGHRSGRVADFHNCYGYIIIRIDGLEYKAHRLAWLYVNGEWPKGFIDHKDGVRDNNRIDNLRESDFAHNGQNRKAAPRTSSSGFLGVTKSGKIWRARIKTNGKIEDLGSFNTPEKAYEAYLKRKREVHAGCTI